VWQEALNEYLSKLDPEDRAYIQRTGSELGVGQDQLQEFIGNLQTSYGHRFSSKALAKMYAIMSHIQSLSRAIDVMAQLNPH
jgi:hypothetical protein